ncbi:hypothetical protein C8F04DRAFT_1190894 [Mycena alexandri]|uniref:Uncharacterized protein n=1 Tax=Mycena alexandri TaxID=1745969 RepID=A0AAD6SFH7_9AGAR|nr:hypothetical protein C8F04DRAFT_1190894 [Mycena alexandri]
MYLPTWSRYTVPRRGEIVPLQQSFVDILASELRFRQRQRHNLELECMRLDRQEKGEVVEKTPVGMLSLSESDSDSEDETDLDYTLPGGGPIETGVREYLLRPRPRPPLADITPIPPVHTESSIAALGFRAVNCDQMRIFADVNSRIGGVFFPPVDNNLWDETIRRAAHTMWVASLHLDRARLDGDSIRSGIDYDPNLKRPRRIDRQHTLSNLVVLATLRYSPAIQEITSFQNAMLHQVAPRLWADANEAIEEVIRNDCDLHAPMKQTDFGAHQLSAVRENLTT